MQVGIFLGTFKSKRLDMGRKETPAERYIGSRVKRLSMHLLAPRPGERILNIINGMSDFNLLFKEHGCQVTVFDLIQDKVDCGGRSSLLSGADDLPFSDNEFDMVTLIESLEVARNPQKLIREAVRICRSKIYIGVQNRHSLVGTQKRISHVFDTNTPNAVHLFSIVQLKRMVRNALGGDVPIKWGSVIFLPYGWYSFAVPVEEYIPVLNNPFGAFLGISFSVAYRYRTIQDRISPFKLGIKSREVSGTFRDTLRTK